MSKHVCPWCNEPFTPRPRDTGGKPQRYCSSGCRTDFHRACRIYAEEQVEAGTVSVGALREALSKHMAAVAA